MPTVGGGLSLLASSNSSLIAYVNVSLAFSTSPGICFPDGQTMLSACPHGIPSCAWESKAFPCACVHCSRLGCRSVVFHQNLHLLFLAARPYACCEALPCRCARAQGLAEALVTDQSGIFPDISNICTTAKKNPQRYGLEMKSQHFKGMCSIWFTAIGSRLHIEKVCAMPLFLLQNEGLE